MSFSPPGGGGGISGATDTAFSNLQNNQVLAYSSSTAKWQNAFMSGGGGGGGVAITVASSDAPDLIKQRADYVCDGSNDQVEINAALEAAQVGYINGAGDGGAGGAVVLSGGTFSINSPILMRSRTSLIGSGRGTQFEPTSSNTQAVIALGEGDYTHMTHLAHFTIHGRRRNAHGIHYRQSAGSYPDISAPDSFHFFEGLSIFRIGSAANPRDGIYLEGTGNGGSRVTWITNTRVRNIWGNGINISSASDCKLSNLDVNTNDEGGGHGIIVGGGNCEISNTKSFYTSRDAFHISSSRAQLVNCIAQDAGRHGYYVSGPGAIVTGCQADSAGRLQSGDGFYITSSQSIITGARSHDRGQTPSSPQRHGFNFAGGQRHFVTGSSEQNSGNAVNGTPGSGSYVRIVTDDAGVISHG